MSKTYGYHARVGEWIGSVELAESERVPMAPRAPEVVGDVLGRLAPVCDLVGNATRASRPQHALAGRRL